MRSQSSSARGVGRALVGLATGGVLAAVIAVVGLQPAESAEGATPVAAPVIAPTTVVAPPVVEAPPAAAPTRSTAATPAPRSRTAAPRTKPRSTSCAEAAMRAGRFDPSCDEYQGHLDRGTAAGREPTSGETQAEWACEQGLIPRSDC